MVEYAVSSTKILDHPNLSSDEIRLLSQFANAVYNDTVNVSGWEAITPKLTDYGLSADLIRGNSFANADLLNIFDGEGDANAVVAQQGNTLVLAFRGTDSFRDGFDWAKTFDHFQLFYPLFEALNKYILANPITKLSVTGHSLGAAVVEHYLDINKADFINGVAFASPRASLNDSDTRLLNIGHENDIVYSISGLRDDNANSTTNIYTVIGDEHGSGLTKEHSMVEYIYTTDRILKSAYYNRMGRDSLVIIDRTDVADDIYGEIPTFSNPDAFILGEDDDDDVIQSGRGNDFLEGLGGNDTLIGDYYSWFSGNDTLDGGKGNDTLDGGKGEDTAIYSGNYKDYKLTLSKDDFKTVTIDHIGGTQEDGTDTLINIEFAQFKDKKVPLKGLDLAFVIDTTGSMFDDIDAVKTSANDIINTIFDNSFPFSRVAVVGYNDPGTNTFLSFTDQEEIADRKTAAINAINSITVGGGGDFPEAVNAGLIRALSGGAGEWNKEAASRTIILFGDAPPKDTQLRAQVLQLASDVGVSSVSGLRAFSIVGDIETRNVTDGLALASFALSAVDTSEATVTIPVQIFTIIIGNDPTTSADFTSLATATGGKTFNAANSREIVSVILEAIDTATQSPNALLDVISTFSDAAVTIDVLRNDSDPNGDPLAITKIGNQVIQVGNQQTLPNGALLIFNSDGTLTYDPNGKFNFLAPDETITDTFTYTISDNTGRTDTADVTVNITGKTSFGIVGTPGNDSLFGNNSDDFINGLGGDDQIFGGEGNNFLIGGAGNDILYGGSGDDRLDGGEGNDVLYGAEGRNTLLGGAGDDTIYGGASDDLIDGGNGNNQIYAAEGNNLIGTGSGNDVVYAGAGSDWVFTGEGNDVIYAAEGNNLIAAGAGDNIIYSGSGSDLFVLTSGVGSTIINQFQSNDRLGLIGGLSYDQLSITQSQQGNEFSTDISITENGDKLASLKWVEASSITRDSFVDAPSLGMSLPNGAPSRSLLAGLMTNGVETGLSVSSVLDLQQQAIASGSPFNLAKSVV